MYNKRQNYRQNIKMVAKINKINKVRVESYKEKPGYHFEKTLGESMDMILNDLSTGGFQGNSTIKLNVNDEIKIELPFLKKEMIKLNGYILSVENSYSGKSEYTYRVQFNRLTNKAEQIISNYINMIQSHEMKEKSIKAYDNGDTTSITDKITKQSGERRNKTDLLKRLPPILSFVGWLIVFLIFLLIFSSRPLARDPISKLLGSNVSHGWNVSILYRAYIFSSVLFVLSIISMFIDLSRQSRKTDFKHKSLLIQFFIGITIMLYFIIKLEIGQRGLFK